MIAGYIHDNVETTQPAIAVLLYVDGVVPSGAKITELAIGFEPNQLAYYRDILKVSSSALAIAPFEATGRAVAQSDPAFKAKFASGTDEEFITSNYIKIFGESPSSQQFSNLQNQINYFTNLFSGNPNAALEARGSVLGQMLGYAFTSDSGRSGLDEQMFTILSGMAKAGAPVASLPTGPVFVPPPSGPGPGTPTGIITLTVGNDTVSPTSVDVNFRSTSSGDTATGGLNNGDVIDMGGGNDTVVGTVPGIVSTDPTREPVIVFR